MSKWIYSGERMVTDAEGQGIRLVYYLEEERRDALGQICLYGIRVDQYREQEGMVIMERRTASALSYSKGVVAELLKKLRRTAVTPTGLWEAVDDEGCLAQDI